MWGGNADKRGEREDGSVPYEVIVGCEVISDDRKKDERARAHDRYSKQ